MLKLVYRRTRGDKIVRKFRIALLAVLILVALCLFSCEETHRISVTYSASEGGTVDGVLYQSKELPKGTSTSFSTVTARPMSGYEFVSWSDGSTEKMRTDTLSESASFEAIFARVQVTTTYLATQGGTLEGVTEQKTDKGALTTEVKAVADEGYVFKGWDDGFLLEARTDNAIEDRTYKAIFEQIDYIEYTYLATQGGKIEGKTEQKTDKVGTKLSPVTAVADEGYRFVSWSDDVTSATREDIARSDKSISAIFIRYYRVSFASANEELGTVSGRLSQVIDEGAKGLAVTATPIKEGYKFLCWSNGDKNATIEYAPTENGTLEAIFVEDFYELPVISIMTNDRAPIVSREEYLGCNISTLKDGEITLSSESANIRGRGNTSWEESLKRPYKIKFAHKVDLFGMGEAKDWTLIPNYTDKSLIRNYVAYNGAKVFDALGETTDCELVELWLNYEYRGVYLVCEQIEAGEGRVDVDDETLSTTDTGYIIELDGRRDGEHVTVSTTLKNNVAGSGTGISVDRYYVIKAPDVDNPYFTDAHREFIRAYLQDCMSALEGNDYSRVCELIDVKSFAQAYIVCELFRQSDVGWSSFYLHKSAGGKIECGPVWDFDRALGNIDYNRDAYVIDNLYCKNNNEWFYGLLRFEEFEALVTKYLWEYKDTLESTLADIYDYVLQRPLSFNRNFVKWNILDGYIRPNPSEMTAIKTWEGQVDFVRTYVARTLAFLLEQYPQ